MKTHYGKRIIALLLIFAFTVVSAPSVFALGESVNLTVKIVIENYDSYSTQCDSMTSSYSVKRIYQMTYKSGSSANTPTKTAEKTFTVKNNSSKVISFSSVSDATCDTYWFYSNASTDRHLSLSSLEYTTSDNLKAYTYSPTGDNSNAYATKPFNWVEAIDSSKKAASITLHFKYNPDIEGLAADPDPSPTYTKTIDYLGDGVTNPDTTVSGKNDYRMYLDVTSQAAAEANKSDIIFVLDSSGSMAGTLSSGETKISVLKSTMTNAIDSLTQNPYNRISLIKFSTSSQILISNSTDKTALTNAINTFSASGSTNYYQSLQNAITEVSTMTASDTESRDKVIIFITDGEPTIANPASQTVNSAQNEYSAMIYGCVSANQISNIDSFYSVFIGSNTGSASTLQTITQMVSAEKEKYMVQATSADQMSDTLNRFISKASNSLYNVTIQDGLSQYVDYNGELKVTETVGSNASVAMTEGDDYIVTVGASDIKIDFLNTLSPSSTYTASFNVRSSDEALDYYGTNNSYPDTGDANTDYSGNTTSSGQKGFYSNTAAKLSYSFGVSGTAEKAYSKPVAQAVEADAVPVEIQVKKALAGKTLEADMFNFKIAKVTEQGNIDVGTAKNDADGNVTFDCVSVSKPGTYTYLINEVIPEIKQMGITYDDSTITAVVTATRSGDSMLTNVAYSPDSTFNNSYAPEPVSVTLEAKKVLTGKTLTADMFDFCLIDSSDDVVETVSNDGSGNIKFSPIPFAEAGEYTYTIEESIPVPVDKSITYDEKTITAKIIVTDNNGSLEASVKYDNNATFTNVFAYSPIKSSIELKVVLTGSQLIKGAFTFVLTDENGKTYTTSNEADGSILFTLCDWTTTGTHTYTIKQVVPTGSSKYTYDESTMAVTVVVADDGTGTLKPSYTYPSDPTFYNKNKNSGGVW